MASVSVHLRCGSGFVGSTVVNNGQHSRLTGPRGQNGQTVKLRSTSTQDLVKS
ncbi:hypothetical protein Hdeb2414_s0019g00549211 [Helianthus debilis subsp. tardiflorus]